MSKYLHYNENQRIESFYDDSIHEVIPANCVKISEEVWNGLLSNTQDFKVKTNLDTDIEYTEISDVVTVEPTVKFAVEVPPTQVEIDFAEYVLSTEDRLEQIERKINGGI